MVLDSVTVVEAEACALAVRSTRGLVGEEKACVLAVRSTHREEAIAFLAYFLLFLPPLRQSVTTHPGSSGGASPTSPAHTPPTCERDEASVLVNDAVRDTLGVEEGEADGDTDGSTTSATRGTRESVSAEVRHWRCSADGRSDAGGFRSVYLATTGVRW